MLIKNILLLMINFIAILSSYSIFNEVKIVLHQKTYHSSYMNLSLVKQDIKTQKSLSRCVKQQKVFKIGNGQRWCSIFKYLLMMINFRTFICLIKEVEIPVTLSSWKTCVFNAFLNVKINIISLYGCRGNYAHSVRIITL